EEPDRVLARRGERHDPARLARAPEAHPRVVDLCLRGEDPRAALGVARVEVARTLRRALARPRPARLGDAALVVRENDEAARGEGVGARLLHAPVTRPHTHA